MLFNYKCLYIFIQLNLCDILDTSQLLIPFVSSCRCMSGVYVLWVFLPEINLLTYLLTNTEMLRSDESPEQNVLLFTPYKLNPLVEQFNPSHRYCCQIPGRSLGVSGISTNGQVSCQRQAR